MAELEIDPQQIASYTALLAEEIEASVKLESGVLVLHALSVKGKPEQVRIVEIYANQEAYEAHLKSPHFLKYKAMTSAMVRSLSFIEADPILLRAKSDVIGGEGR